MQTIITSFDKYAKRNLERVYANWKTIGPKEKKKLNEVDMLLSKRAFIPGFYRHILKKVANNQIIRRQEKILLTAFMLSLLNPKGTTMNDIIRNTKKQKTSPNKNELQEPYTRRHYQRILNEYYLDAFFKPKRSTNESEIDDRFTNYSTIVSPTKPHETLYSNFVGQQYSTLLLNNFSDEFLITWMSFSVTLQLITPEVLENIQSVNETCKATITRELKTIEQNLQKTKNTYEKTKLRERKRLADFLFSEFSNFSPIFIGFYFHFASILAWRWLHSRQPTKRRELLVKGFPLRFSASEISRSRKLLYREIKSEDRVNSRLMNALQEYAFVTKSHQNFKDCVRASQLPEIDCGIIFENVATIYRERKDYKLMRAYLKHAIKHYKNANDTYRICVTIKNLGEAEWHLGFTNKALKLFKESEKKGESLTDLTQRFGVLWNLACSMGRIGETKLKKSYLIKCLQILPETETDKILAIEQMLKRWDPIF